MAPAAPVASFARHLEAPSQAPAQGHEGIAAAGLGCFGVPLVLGPDVAGEHAELPVAPHRDAPAYPRAKLQAADAGPEGGGDLAADEERQARAPHLPRDAGPAEEALLAIEAGSSRVGRVAAPALEEEGAPLGEDAGPLEGAEVRNVRRAGLVRTHVFQRVLDRGRAPIAELALQADAPPNAGSVDEERRVELGAMEAPVEPQGCPAPRLRGQAQGAGEGARLHHRQRHALLQQDPGRVAVAEPVRSAAPPPRARGPLVAALQADVGLVPVPLAPAGMARPGCPPRWHGAGCAGSRRSARGRREERPRSRSARRARGSRCCRPTRRRRRGRTPRVGAAWCPGRLPLAETGSVRAAAAGQAPAGSAPAACW